MLDRYETYLIEAINQLGGSLKISPDVLFNLDQKSKRPNIRQQVDIEGNILFTISEERRKGDRRKSS
jgi:hypothetical protein